MVNPQVGWCLPEERSSNADIISTSRLIELLRDAKVGKLKLPIWFDANDPGSSDILAERIDRVQGSGVTCIGVIGLPRVDSTEFHSQQRNRHGAALEDSVLTQAYLEPVFQQMCVRLINFQLGWDDEATLSIIQLSNRRSKPSFECSIDTVKKHKSPLPITHRAMVYIEIRWIVGNCHPPSNCQPTKPKRYCNKRYRRSLAFRCHGST